MIDSNWQSIPVSGDIVETVVNGKVYTLPKGAATHLIILVINSDNIYKLFS